MGNPYLITGPALISFSGGRTSGYMLKMILDAHGGQLPDDVHVCFANTGKEREETLRFVHDCSTIWGVSVHWLEWRSRSIALPLDERFAEVGFNSASRNGEPFAAMLLDRSYLPNAVARFCTTELKVRIIKWYMQSRGFKNWANVIGLRADEPSRIQRSRRPTKECWTNAMPLAVAGVTNRDVRAFWDVQPFDLDLLPFEGNCDACFLKARPKLWEVERTRPGTLDWWIAQEAMRTARFRSEYSYAELKADVCRQPDMFAGGLFDDDPEMDAECGLWCAGEAA